MHKITSLELLRTPILCFSATKQIMRMRGTDAQKHLSQWEKVAKCNFKSKAQAHEKCFFLMKWTFFCNAEDRFSWVWAYFAEKVILELNAQITSLELLRTPILCFSATKQIMRMRGHRCSKTSFSVRKVAKCNFKSKAQVHEKMFLSNEMNSFFAMQKTDFHEFELIFRKSHFRA